MLPLSKISRGVAGLSARALDALLPARCLSCAQPVDAQRTLCPDCWAGIDFVAPPFCACCGYPFAFDTGPEALCGACAREAPAYDRARFVMRYDEASRRLVLGFKHGDRLEGASSFALWIARAGRELLAGADLIAPVPLHPIRLFTRRYNQAALLAQALAKATGVPAEPGLLLRRRHTPPQGRFGAAARQRNVAGAFAVAPRHRAALAGRRVLLVDDVMTTGATVSACARVLRRQGAAGVDVLVLARVIRPQA